MQRRVAEALVAVLFVFFAGSCASHPKPAEDDRIVVSAVLTGSDKPASIISYEVTVRNNADGMITIKRVEVEPIGGASVRPAYVAATKQIEPGEIAVFGVWTEVDLRHQESRTDLGAVMGVGNALARVHVTFLYGTERVIASYLLKLL